MEWSQTIPHINIKAREIASFYYIKIKNVVIPESLGDIRDLNNMI